MSQDFEDRVLEALGEILDRVGNLETQMAKLTKEVTLDRLTDACAAARKASSVPPEGGY